jgi:hypothetical protein
VGGGTATGGGARLKATGRDRPVQSNAFARERDSGDPPASLAVLIAYHCMQRCEVERPGHPQGPGQGTAAFRRSETRRVGMQVRPATREPTPAIGYGDTVLRHYPQQLRRRRASAAADAGAYWPGRFGHDSGGGVRHGNRRFGGPVPALCYVDGRLIDVATCGFYVGPDVDAPAGQPRREPGVLPLTSDG